MSNYTYEESVHWMRRQPELSQMVEFCYLDQDNLAAAKRFEASEEFFEVVKILKIERSPRKLKILDLGCGNGIASYAFASLGHDISAVDPDESEDVGLGATRKLAARLNNGSIFTYQAFAEALPFENATFDIVYARQALHHFTDLHKGLSECARVLKPQGLFFATREHVVSNNEQLQTFLAEHLLHKLHSGENAYPLNDYLSAIKGANIKVSKLFAPFDTVINYFPASNLELKDSLLKGLTKKLGKLLAEATVKIPFIENFYRYYLSQTCKFPGRLYSFFGSKQEIK
ncbi:MAG: class I SAM-dependent methyltransferase [Chroococcus sp. CMT-3BRIN-NPC107]|jgi:SAM-dependent methyltransferase|nr:class I SAM-dependent methyltransferase [Chroococcus sp. CMT-3BRIN-NPC107]